MVSRRKPDPDPAPKRHRAATTPEARESQLISLAHDLAEKRLRDGTATGAEVVHLLRLGSSREQLEQARLAADVKLAEAKIEALASQTRSEELLQRAIEAMTRYRTDDRSGGIDEYQD
jgi:hypothetical protein